MIGLLLVAMMSGENSFAPVCYLTAGVIKSSLVTPRAVIYVNYDSGVCGEGPPTFESDTVAISDVEMAEPDSENATRDCGASCTTDEETGDRDCAADCPWRVFIATVTGPIGQHRIQVYAENEGFDTVILKLRGFTERSKLAGQ